MPRAARDTLVPPPPPASAVPLLAVPLRSNPASVAPRIGQAQECYPAAGEHAECYSAARRYTACAERYIADDLCVSRQIDSDQKDGRRSATRLSGSWPTAGHAQGPRRRTRSVTGKTPRAALDGPRGAQGSGTVVAATRPTLRMNMNSGYRSDGSTATDDLLDGIGARRAVPPRGAIACGGRRSRRVSDVPPSHGVVRTRAISRWSTYTAER